jgi:hypothetical protein
MAGARGAAIPEMRHGAMRSNHKASAGFAAELRAALRNEKERAVNDLLADSDDEKLREAARDLKEHYIDQGELGISSGERFYRYPPNGELG